MQHVHKSQVKFILFFSLNFPADQQRDVSLVLTAAGRLPVVSLAVDISHFSFFRLYRQLVIEVVGEGRDDLVAPQFVLIERLAGVENGHCGGFGVGVQDGGRQEILPLQPRPHYVVGSQF